MTGLRFLPGILAQQQSRETAHERVEALVATLSGVEFYAKMDDAASNATCVDSSGNGRDGTYGTNGSITTAVAGPNSDSDIAYLPVSDTGRVDVPDNAAWDSVLAAFCVINRDGGLYGCLLDRDDEGSGGVNRAWQFRINHTNSKLEFLRTGGSASTVSSTSTLSIGTEYTVGWWRNSSTGVLTLYIDGVAAGTGSPGAINASGASPITIGAHLRNLTYTQSYGGDIGSVVLLSSADSSTIPALHAAWAGT